MVGEKVPSATDGGKREPVPIYIEGRQQTCDASTNHTTVISKHVSSTHTPLKWADETPTLSRIQQRRQDPQETPLPQLKSGPHSINLPPIIKTSILPKYTLPLHLTLTRLKRKLIPPPTPAPSMRQLNYVGPARQEKRSYRQIRTAITPRTGNVKGLEIACCLKEGLPPPLPLPPHATADGQYA